MANRVPPATKELAKALYIQGVRFPVISAHVGVAQNVLRSWSTRYHWKQLATQSLQLPQQSLKRGLIVETRNSLQAMGEEIRKSLAAELESQVKLLASNPATSLKELATTKGTQGRASVVKTIVETAAQVHGWDSSSNAGLVLIGDLSSDRPEREPPALDIVAEVTAAPVGDILPDDQPQVTDSPESLPPNAPIPEG